MHAKQQVEPNGLCLVKHYVAAWALGTGLRVGLKPGEYRITGGGDVNGVAYLQLDGVYRCPADVCDQTRSGQAVAVDARI